MRRISPPDKFCANSFAKCATPNLSNKETTKYLAYDDHKNLEKEINKFIESGGIQE